MNISIQSYFFKFLTCLLTQRSFFIWVSSHIINDTQWVGYAWVWNSLNIFIILTVWSFVPSYFLSYSNSFASLHVILYFSFELVCLAFQDFFTKYFSLRNWWYWVFTNRCTCSLKTCFLHCFWFTRFRDTTLTTYTFFRFCIPVSNALWRLSDTCFLQHLWLSLFTRSNFWLCIKVGLWLKSRWSNIWIETKCVLLR